ncbi:MAG: carbohydrate kinase family protein [Lachnospiraceae bacterium]
MAEIIIIGAAIIDVIARPVSEKVFKTGSCPMDDICMTTGADALNEALILSKMGKNVRLEAVFGDDEAGKLIQDQCRKNHIMIEERQIHREIPTGINVVLVDENGERCFLTNPNGSLRSLRLEDIRMPFEDDAKILCFASIFVFPKIGADELLRIFAQAKRQGITVCADMTKCKYGETLEEMKEAFSYIDYLMPNEEEACLITGQSDTENAARSFIKAGVKNVIIKCGKRGCLVMNKYESYMVSAKENACCIDTTGAGDSFAAGFICALSEGKSLRECAQFANECGAKAVGVMGATQWL